MIKLVFGKYLLGAGISFGLSALFSLASFPIEKLGIDLCFISIDGLYDPGPGILAFKILLRF